MQKNNMKIKSILLLGSDSILGSALKSKLNLKDQIELFELTHDEIDCITPSQLQDHIKKISPGLVINVYNRGGGIGKNQRIPADLFMQNIMHDMHLLPSCHMAGVNKYVNILPNCIYPEGITVPFKESDLWKGYPEETISYYAMTKKLTLVQANAFRKQYNFNSINLIVTATYGPNDIFDPLESQVIPSMIAKFSEAIESKNDQITFWGSGKATREFIYEEDAAEAILISSFSYNDRLPLNICTSEEISIKELARLISSKIGFNGEILWDHNKPEGILRKCLSNERLCKAFDFTPSTSIAEGINKAIQGYYKKIKGKD
jgi:GDP-L-fucose synthase